MYVDEKLRTLKRGVSISRWESDITHILDLLSLGLLDLLRLTLPVFALRDIWRTKVLSRVLRRGLKLPGGL